MLAADSLGELPGEPLEVRPGDDVAFDVSRGGRLRSPEEQQRDHDVDGGSRGR